MSLSGVCKKCARDREEKIREIYREEEAEKVEERKRGDRENAATEVRRSKACYASLKWR